MSKNIIAITYIRVHDLFINRAFLHSKYIRIQSNPNQPCQSILVNTICSALGTHQMIKKINSVWQKCPLYRTRTAYSQLWMRKILQCGRPKKLLTKYNYKLSLLWEWPKVRPSLMSNSKGKKLFTFEWTNGKGLIGKNSSETKFSLFCID